MTILKPSTQIIYKVIDLIHFLKKTNLKKLIKTFEYNNIIW